MSVINFFSISHFLIIEETSVWHHIAFKCKRSLSFFPNSLNGFAKAFRCVDPILLIITTKLETALGKGRMDRVAFWDVNDEVLVVTLISSTGEFKNS